MTAHGPRDSNGNNTCECLSGEHETLPKNIYMTLGSHMEVLAECLPGLAMDIAMSVDVAVAMAVAVAVANALAVAVDAAFTLATAMT